MQKDPEAAAQAGRLLRFFAFGADARTAARRRPRARCALELAAQRVCDDADAVLAAIDAIGERRDGLDYDIDGAVVRLHEPAAFDAAGFNSAEPRGAIAFKYPPEEKLTKLLAVEWPVGKIGRVAPRARVEPVFVGGVTVENITLHNPRLIRERDLRIGDTVAVVRRGDVIPFAGRSIPEDRDGTEQVDRAADALPVVRHRARGPRHGRGALVPEPAVPGAGDAAADALGLAPRRPTWRASATSGSRSSPTTACSSAVSDFYALTAEQLLGYERMGEVSADEHGRLDRAAPRALGLRRALIGLAIPMASEGIAKRLCLAGYERIEDVAAATRRGARGDPRHRPEGRRERRRVLRPAGGARGDRRAARATASTSTSSTRTGRSTSPPRPTRR